MTLTERLTALKEDFLDAPCCDPDPFIQEYGYSEEDLKQQMDQKTTS